MHALTCLIPAAGAGIRARPKTDVVPKALLKVGGKPILQHSIELVRDQLGIRSIIIVIGHLGQSIKDYFGNGDWLNVTLCYVDNQDLEKGLTWSIYLGKNFVEDFFLVLLGDEFYRNTNHSRLNEFTFAGTLATCGAIQTNDEELIRQNYTIEYVGERISRLIEKPQKVTNNLMGTGTFLLSPEIFPMIAERYKKIRHGSVDFIELLDDLCRKGYRINAFMLQGDYVNINNAAALERANTLMKRE